MKKLFIWNGVLCDYTCGIIFGIAETPKEIIDKLIEEGSIYTHMVEPRWDGDREFGEIGPPSETHDLRGLQGYKDKIIAVAVWGGG